jgi:DNA polymerase III delta subunit
MLYVFYGTDAAQAGEKARALVESLRQKRPDAAYEKIDADSWDPSVLQSHLGGQGLFSNKYIVFVDRVTENKSAKEELADYIEAMQESPNIFILYEGKVLTELKKALEKHAEKIVVVDEKKAAGSFFGGGDGPNIFALADAVGKRDAVRAWTLYRQAVDGGIESEAIIGMLFWKAKSLENKALAKRLVTLYHDGHRGLCDLELGIEKLVLEAGR